MVMLILGVLLFACVHFIPSLAPSIKANWQEKMGENGYKGVFSLLLLASFGLMIMGWRGAEPTYLYSLPPASRMLALALTALGFFFFIVSNRPSRLRLIVRHPQLTGVALWALAHLMLNGDDRSLVLFGGLLLWSMGEMLAINRRDGVWIKDQSPSWGTEAVNVIVTGIVIAVVVFLHPYLSGVRVI